MKNFFTELKAHREASGISLEAIFERTRIDLVYLKALESGQFNVLPEVYIQLFLKKYAQEIGLNPHQVLENYKVYKTPLKPLLRTTNIVQNSGLFSLKLLLLFTLVLTLVIGIFTLVFVLDHRPGPPSKQTNEEQALILSEIKSIVDNADTSAKEMSQFFTSRNEPLENKISQSAQKKESTKILNHPFNNGQSPSERILAAYSLSMELPKINQDSLLTLTGQAIEAVQAVISSDGKTIFSGLLIPDRLYQWQAQNRFLIKVGKASALDLSLQGHPLEPLEKSNHRRRVFISRSSIWIEDIDSLSSSVSDL